MVLIKLYFRQIRVHPMHTFLRRFVVVHQYLIRRSIFNALSAVGLAGGQASESIEESRLAEVRLSRDSILGDKGERVILPIDNAIIKTVCRVGYWESFESRFLVDQIAKQPESTILSVIDIGAHVGLVSRQIARLSKRDLHFHLVEPVPLHLYALKRNFKNLDRPTTFHEYGLAEYSGVTKITTEAGNSGNSTIQRDAARTIEHGEVSQVPVLSALEFGKNLVKLQGKFVLKSDIQGMDAQVLSLFPQEFWQRTIAASVEIWSLESIEVDAVQKLINVWSHEFSICVIGAMEFEPRMEITMLQLRDIWLNRSGQFTNAFLHRR